MLAPCREHSVNVKGVIFTVVSTVQSQQAGSQFWSANWSHTGKVMIELTIRIIIYGISWTLSQLCPAVKFTLYFLVPRCRYQCRPTSSAHLILPHLQKRSTLVPEPMDISLVWHISLQVLFPSLSPVCSLTALPQKCLLVNKAAPNRANFQKTVCI